MKKLMLVMVTVLAVAALATPGFAGVEFKYGGYFDVRAQWTNNVMDGKNTNSNALDVLPLQRIFNGQTPNDSASVYPASISAATVGSGGGQLTNYKFDDKASWVDQRLRMYFSFVASERLQVVTKWEADTIWGMSGYNVGTGAIGRTDGTPSSYSFKQGGGGVGADEANLEMKNVYVDFLIPETPLRATVGVQGIDLMKGWILSDDFSAAVISGKYAPVAFSIGYIAGRNANVYSTQDNIDDLLATISYAEGPFSASLVALWESANSNATSTFLDFNHNDSVNDWWYGANAARTVVAGATTSASAVGRASAARTLAVGTGLTTLGGPLTLGPQVLNNNDLVDLGVSLGFKTDMVNAYVNYVQNLGSADIYNASPSAAAAAGVPRREVDSVDYKGFMVEAGANFYIPSFTFTVGGFYTSGEDARHYLEGPSSGRMTKFDGFLYPVGASHYWAEIAGVGFFDARTNTIPDRNVASGGWSGGDTPSNVWTASVGAAWQALPTTKLTANYYYIGTSQMALAGVNIYARNAAGVPTVTSLDYDQHVGQELDLYLDQDIVDGLKLKLGAAYLWAGDAYTVYNGDDDAWQLGAALIWAF